MKYVRPYTLYMSLEKKAIELIKNDAIGIQLLGLNVLPHYFSISISNPYIDGAVHHGIVEMNGRNISKLTNVFQTLIPKYNIEAAVIGCPDAKNMENLEDVKVNSVAYALCNTGKFEGLKFTYWDTTRIDSKFVEWMSKDPNLPDDHPDNNLEDFHDRFSSVYTLQSYLDHFGKMAQRKDD
ncbi:hypothetical protein EZV62_025027 [Acer yangbiense]|uniref:Uncharacterized protein n=1 Tax=Acer yangbiense TaxID=1000413 RepID=A0A5C7GXW9_9ROSI|nr:hypothetical protein EZV62_025027 [Acer yangbiense]